MSCNLPEKVEFSSKCIEVFCCLQCSQVYNKSRLDYFSMQKKEKEHAFK